MKKLILITLLSLLFSGCYYTELNDLAIIDTFAIEKISNNYLLYITVVDTLEYKNDNNKKVNIYKASGKTIENAYQNLYLELSKTIYLSSINNLLISDNLKKNDLKSIISFFINDKNSSNTFNIIYVKNSNIIDILKTNINLGDLLITNKEAFGITDTYSLEEFYKDNSKYSFVPTIYYKDKVLVDNYSIFKNYNYIGQLNKNQSIIYNILENKINNFSLNLENDYIYVSNIKTRFNVLNNKEISILSSINKDKKEEYNNYLNSNIKNFIDKYDIYNNMNIKINTTVGE